MTGIDTNVLVRYLVNDDAAQAAAASRLLNDDCSADNPAFVTVVALCETVWVLKAGYSWSRAQISNAIEALLQMEQVVVEHQAVASLALEDYRASAVDFADACIQRIGALNGAPTTKTFDVRASQMKGFDLLQHENSRP